MSSKYLKEIRNLITQARRAKSPTRARQLAGILIELGAWDEAEKVARGKMSEYPCPECKGCAVVINADGNEEICPRCGGYGAIEVEERNGAR